MCIYCTHLFCQCINFIIFVNNRSDETIIGRIVSCCIHCCCTILYLKVTISYDDDDDVNYDCNYCVDDDDDDDDDDGCGNTGMMEIDDIVFLFK